MDSTIIPTSWPNNALTAREKEIVIMIASGLSSRQIALKLGISFKTVLVHRYSAMQKLGVKNVAQRVGVEFGEGTRCGSSCLARPGKL